MKREKRPNVTEGKWEVEGSWIENPIDVYDHPKKGLCVWFPDYCSRGGIDIPVFTDGDGHVPIWCSGLKFIRKVGD